MATANCLSEALTEHLQLLNDLHQTLQDEQKAIVAIDTKLMESLNCHKEQLIVRQRKVTETVQGVMAKTAVQLGLSPSATLSEIVCAMPPEMKIEVQPLQQAIKQAAADVSLLASQNRSLLEKFLGVVNESLSFILRILNTSNIYGRSGTYITNIQAGAVMVNKEA